jgi:hypothetical protein
MRDNRYSCDWRHVKQGGFKSADKRKCIGLTCVLLWVVCCATGANGKYSGGNGDSGNPFLISSPEDLAQIGNNPDDWDKHFLLMSDIDMKDYNTPGALQVIGYLQWDPYISKPFKGVFDGNNKKIINLTITHAGKDFTGLFGYILGKKAMVKDTTLVNPKITGIVAMYTGTIAGKLKNGTITGCNIEGGVIRGNINVGGLVGYNFNGILINCTVNASVYGATNVGGITAYHSGNIMQNCTFSGAVYGIRDIGGLAGDNDVNGQIVNCSVKGTVSGAEDKVAGLVGTSRGSIKFSYAIANVTGHQQTGGLVGRNTGTILDCYSQGKVNGTYCVGGLVGLLYDGGSITRCYSTANMAQDANQISNLIGFTDSGIVAASFSRDNASDTQMMTEKTYTNAGWQFVGEAASKENPWTICENMNYPRLSWEKLYSGDLICPEGVDIFDIALLCENWLTKKASADIYLPRSFGTVNFRDWVIFSKAWQQRRDMTGWNAQCDLWPEEGDGVIDEMDLSVFISRWLTNGAGQYDIAPVLRGDQIVNFRDFTAATENYLKQ